MASPTGRALIFGCGYLGSRVAKAWLAAGRPVTALTRNRAKNLSKEGIDPIVGDVLEPASLREFPETSTILYAVGMDRSAGRSMREVYVQGLRNALEAVNRSSPQARFIYISSTSVYGQTDGSWVTESSPTDPLEESGKIILEAEAILRELRPDAIVLRFAGIYGPDRLLRLQPLLRGEPLVGDAEKWLNLIHVADGVKAVLAAEARGSMGERYLISDGEPVSRKDFYTYLAELVSAPPAKFEPTSAKGEPNRRISNAKTRTELGFAPEFPNYRIGLR